MLVAGRPTPTYVHYHDRRVGPTRRATTRACSRRSSSKGSSRDLSWLTILRKRENFRAAFAGFDIERRGAASATTDVSRGCSPTRGSSAIAARSRPPINNARALSASSIAEHGSLAAFVWQFEPSVARARRRRARTVPGVPSTTPDERSLVEGPQEARVELRRPHHGLRVHAGDGPRERPPRRLCARETCARAAHARRDIAHDPHAAQR